MVRIENDNFNRLFVIEIILSEMISETGEIIDVKKFYEACKDDIEIILKKGYDEILKFINENMKVK